MYLDFSIKVVLRPGLGEGTEMLSAVLEKVLGEGNFAGDCSRLESLNIHYAECF